ncbi:WD domain, G-beta repeat protein [Babesia caballi]|uniref:WD domain, G-beta repeat protein n=1 Tax=Babesia caballi TaxID=5871 RepID=A0AAV4LNW0_BABCB|nr:WD domain, G-beta repeat protein [Babesia caballi]
MVNRGFARSTSILCVVGPTHLGAPRGVRPTAARTWDSTAFQDEPAHAARFVGGDGAAALGGAVPVAARACDAPGEPAALPKFLAEEDAGRHAAHAEAAGSAGGCAAAEVQGEGPVLQRERVAALRGVAGRGDSAGRGWLRRARDALAQGADTARPCVKVYSLPETVGEEPVLRATAWSGFDDAWYAGAWSLDGAAITAVDRGDRLQRVAVSEPADCELDAAAAVSLASEVYGLLYTSDALVVQKVDGCIDIMSPEFVLRASEQAHSHIVLAAAYNKERDLLATGGSDHVVHVFSCADDYTCVGSFSGLEGKVSSVSFSPDGMLLAWGTKDTSHVASEEVAGPEGGSPEEYYLTVAGTDPCEVYLQVRMPAAVSHVQFAPTGYAIAYACDLDLMPKGSSVPSAVGVLNLA